MIRSCSACWTLEESSTEIVLYLRDGGMRFVPCAGAANERHAVYEMVQEALRSLPPE